MLMLVICSQGWRLGCNIIMWGLCPIGGIGRQIFLFSIGLYTAGTRNMSEDKIPEPSHKLYFNARFDNPQRIAATLDSTTCLPLINTKTSSKANLAPRAIVEGFQRVMKENRSYLGDFGGRVQKVYERELLRNRLKEKYYQNTIKEMEGQKAKVEQMVLQAKEDKIRNFRPIITENQKLEELKKNYQLILAKEEEKLAHQTLEYNKLSQQNQQLRQKIKTLWRNVQTSKPPTNEPDNDYIAEQANSSIYITSKGLQFVPGGNSEPVSHLSTDRKPLTRTRHTEVDELENLNTKLRLRKTESISTNKSSAALQTALKRIESMESSIHISKKTHRNRSMEVTTGSEEALRKEKITQRMQQIEHKNQMLKLFLLYLKGNEATENKTGLSNIWKVICIVERAIEHRDQVLSQAKSMYASLKN